jgi:VanZ family protein
MLLLAAFWLPVVLYVSIILTVSAQPSLRPPLSFTWSDKFWHLAEYGVLGVLLVRALDATMRPRAYRTVAVLTVVLGGLFAAGDETFQSFVPGRESSVADAVADIIGLALATVAYGRFSRKDDR